MLMSYDTTLALDFRLNVGMQSLSKLQIIVVNDGRQEILVPKGQAGTLLVSIPPEGPVAVDILLKAGDKVVEQQSFYIPKDDTTVIPRLQDPTRW